PYTTLFRSDLCWSVGARSHFSRLFPRFCHQSADVPLPYLAPRCPYRRANGWERHPGWRVAKDGHLWFCAFEPAPVACGESGHARFRRLPGHYWYPVWCPGGYGAARYETPYCLLQRQPYGFSNARDFCPECRGGEWRHPADDQPRRD